MPDKLNRSQPDKWFMPLKELPSAKLAPGEILASILHMEIENIQRKEIIHNMFAVTRNGNKAIAKFIICHRENGAYCNGHASIVAEYPIENQKELIEEIKDHGLMMGVAVATGASPNLKLDPSKPAFYLQTPEDATNEKILMKFALDNDPLGDTAKQIITTVLGLKAESGAPQAFTETIENLFQTGNTPSTTLTQPTTLTPKQNEDLAPTNNLAKAAKEMELIKKYGKKPMQELAKKMNYQWAGHHYTRKTIKK